MKKLAILGLVACFVAGCTGSDDGDVEAAQKAIQAGPKTAADLPVDQMPPDARRGAEAAMGAAQMQQQSAMEQNAARSRAMQEMQKQRGGG